MQKKKQSQEQDMLSFALQYANKSLPVFPLHYITDQGQCSCGNDKCKSQGKHPIYNGGFKLAVTDEISIRELWKKHPFANIGVPTGAVSNWLVLDIDPKNGGEDSFDKLESMYGKISDNVYAVTGSGGRHFVFKYPGSIGRCMIDAYKGIDIRGDGGYIVVAPSNHLSGNEYFWDAEADPLDGVSPVDMPDWLADKLVEKKSFPSVPVAAVVLSDAEIKRIRMALIYVPADNRDDWLALGMALQASNAGNQAFGLWCEWASQSAKFDLVDSRRVWDSFKPDGGLSIASVFGIAKSHGWVSPESNRPPDPPIESYADDFEIKTNSSKLIQSKKNQQPSKNNSDDNESNFNKSILQQYLFISSRNRIFDTINGTELIRDAFDGLFLNVFFKPKASTWLLQQDECIKVNDLIYLPGETENPVHRGTSILWNIWRDPGVELPEIATVQSVEPWLEHMNYLYPDRNEQNHMLNWFSSILQNPQIKINHALVIAGTSRIGKDMLLNPIRYGLGDRNICEPSATELTENYTDYLHHAKLVIFQEIMNFQALNLENKLKVMLASPPDLLRVRLFGRGFYETPNIVQAIFMSNYRDALHISEGDGRYFAAWSNVKPCSEKYYHDLWEWLESSGNGLVVRWLLDRDNSGFNPKKPAPMTSFKSEIIKTSHSPLKFQLMEMIRGLDFPFNVDCVRSLDVSKTMRDKYSAKSIGSVLSELGCIKKECRRSSGKREKASLFAVRNFDEWEEKSVIKWFDEYDLRKVKKESEYNGT